MVKIRKIITVVLEWYIVSIFGYLQFILPKMNKLNFWVAGEYYFDNIVSVRVRYSFFIKQL